MKVKDLIKLLEAQNENATVIIKTLPSYDISFKEEEE